MRSLARLMVGNLWLLGLVMWAPACDDSAAPTCDCEPAITFLSPTGGALTEFHDQDANELGIQVDVRLRTHCIPDGTRLLYTNSQVPGEQVEGRVVLDDAATGDGHVDLGMQTFLEGSNRVCASGGVEVTWLAEGEGSCSARLVDPVEGCKDVLVQLGLPACRFDVPQDGATLVAAEDASGAPGFQHDVVLTCKGIDDGALLSLVVGAALPLETALRQASASFTAVELGEGLNLLRAEVADPDGNPVGAEISVIVDTGGCAVRLLPPDGSVLRAADDQDPVAEGLQIRAEVETDADGAFACPDGAAVTLDVGGELSQGVLAGGRAEFVVTLADGTHAAFATVAAPGGPEGRSLTNVYRVCATSVAVALEAPAEGVTLTDTSDRDPAAMGIQIAVRGTSQGVTSPDGLWLELDGVVVEEDGAPLQPALFQPGGAF
ncbi:MAG TPA: hypothetical protein P5076_18355, partial [Myxococcota bacterium]|nr:hypothetical protein [Myxococcota bacterium]